MNKKAYFIILYLSKKHTATYFKIIPYKEDSHQSKRLSLLVNTELALCFEKGHCAESSY